MNTLVLNFSHPLTDAQARDILDSLEISGDDVMTILDIAVQIDMTAPLAEQITAIVDKADLSPVAWQSIPFVVRLPGMSEAGAALLAEIHGRCGYFPRIVTMRRDNGVFVVNDIVDLQDIRETARGKR